MEGDQPAARGFNSPSGERVRTPGSPKSKSTNVGTAAAIEQSRVRERRVEIDATNKLEAWKMFDDDTVFHFRLDKVTICGFGPTDKPEYLWGRGGTIAEADHACRLCQTAARQQGVELLHPASGEPV